MIELKQDRLVVSFPEVHRDATLRIEFQRTLRIPDDQSVHRLPPGLGRFPLRHVDDFGERVPERWEVHGGVMLPMYQAEAMWLNFTSPNGYPFAVKVATGKIDAVTGEPWREGLAGKPQSHLSVPTQPWLDGYCVERGVIRQFVAMPLGGGYSAEEQITGKAEHGGLQIAVYPLKADAWRRMQRRPRRGEFFGVQANSVLDAAIPLMDMGLAPGGRMRQEIYDDPHPISDWDQAHSSRCFVHIANSLVWRSITGEEPPTVPPTAEEYTRAGLPWFEWYSEHPALPGGDPLRKLKSVRQLGQEKGDAPLPENASVDPKNVIGLRGPRKRDEVREGVF
jgi:hypothetical protein